MPDILARLHKRIAELGGPRQAPVFHGAAKEISRLRMKYRQRNEQCEGLSRMVVRLSNLLKSNRPGEYDEDPTVSASREIGRLRAQLHTAKREHLYRCWGGDICADPPSLNPDHHEDHCPAGVALQAVEDAGSLPTDPEDPTP